MTNGVDGIDRWGPRRRAFARNGQHGDATRRTMIKALNLKKPLPYEAT
jgi:hypothetical protein